MQTLYRGSLARRLLAASFIMLALPLLLYFIIIFRGDYQVKLRDTIVRLKELGKSRALLLSDLTKFNFRALSLVEEYFHLQETYPTQPSNTMQKALEHFTQAGNFDFISYYTITDDGRYICTASSDKAKIGKDYSEHHYVRNAVIYDHMSFLAFGTTSFQRRFYVTKTVYSKTTRRRTGILTIATSVDDLLKKLISRAKSPYPIYFSLLTEDHVVFASSYADLALRILTPLSQDERKKIDAKRQFGGATLRESNITITPIADVTNGMELHQGDTTNIAFFLPIPGTDLTLLLHANKEDVFRDERTTLVSTVAIFTFIFLICILATLWITLRMGKPLESLCGVMNEVSLGNLSARYKKDPMGFEINMTGEIFNQTITRLIKNMEVAEKEKVEKETLAKELKIGYDIQTSILPKQWPSFPGIEIAARYSPAKEVGGDFYDIFVKEGKNGQASRLFLSIADAAGKGISACLYSLGLRSILRSNYMEHEDIATMMENANMLFIQDTEATDMFVTLLTTIFDPKTKTLTYCSCGHTPGFVRRLDGSIEALNTPGIAMGIAPYENVKGQSMQLCSGDVILLYTDGITEAMNPRNELFGEKRLLEFLQKNSEGSVDEIADRLMEAIHLFSQGIPQHDDITTIVLRVL